jgi:hypothetical protein
MLTRRALAKLAAIMTYGAGGGHRRPDQRIAGTQRPGAGPAPSSSVVVARRVIVVGPDDGIFVYNGAPAHGNLVASITSQSGTDPYGNTYDATIASYDNVFGGVTVINGALIQQFAGVDLISEYGPAGIFIYSPAGGLGNLIASITPAGGTDAYGNTYVAGLSSYSGPTVGQLFGGALTLNSSGNLHEAELSALPGQLFLQSPAISGTDGNATLALFSEQEANADFGLAMPVAILGYGGSPVSEYAAMLPVQPGTGNPETWHNLGAPIAGWAVSIARYRILSDSALVLVEFQNVQPPAAAPADGTTIWTAANGLPAPYPPNNNTRISCYANAVAAASGVPAFQFQNDGSITVYGIHNANPSRMDGTFILSTI